MIDEIIRDLHALRGQLAAELRADEDAGAARADALPGEAKREGAGGGS